MLTTAAGATALNGLDSVDRLWVADKHAFDSPLAAPLAVGGLLPPLRGLRAERYDALLLLHHLTTWFGTLKYALLCSVIGARRTVGLDNGRGLFLDVRVPDEGFGYRHEVDYCLAVAAAAGAAIPQRPRLEVVPAAPPALPAEYIAVHAGGGSYSLARRWPVEDFAAVARALGSNVVLVGTEVDGEVSAELERLLDRQATNLVGQTSVGQTAAVLAGARLLISNDSGVVHLAAAVGTPVVAVFGPSNDDAWGPYPPDEHRVVRASLPCSPCFYRGKSLGTPEGCATRDCLRLVTPDMVLAAARELLGGRAAVAAS